MYNCICFLEICKHIISMAEANESSNAHLDQSPSPDQFVSREQFDALTEEHEKVSNPLVLLVLSVTVC